jgi:hypothetical protein
MQESTCLFHHLLSLAFLFLSNPSLTLCVLLQPVTPPSSYNAKPPNPTTTHGTQRGADCVSEAGRPNVRTSRSVLTNTPGNRLHSLFAISSPQNLQPFHPFRIFKPSRWRELFTISLVRPFMLFWPSYMVVFLTGRNWEIPSFRIRDAPHYRRNVIGVEPLMNISKYPSILRLPY